MKEVDGFFSGIDFLQNDFLKTFYEIRRKPAYRPQSIRSISITGPCRLEFGGRSLGFGVQGLGCGVQDLGLRLDGSGFRVKGFEFRV